MKKILVASLCLSGCAMSVQQRAYIVGKSSKEIVDAEAAVWDKAANARITECEKKLTPPEEHTKAEFDECLGPFNEKVQEKVVLVLESIRAAQLALFLALAQNKTEPEVKQALSDLAQAVSTYIQLVQEKK